MTDYFADQIITKWARTGTGGMGAPTVSSPSIIRGRWQDKQLKQYNTSGATDLVFETVIYTGSLLSIGDFVYLGRSTATNPLTVSGTREIRAVGKSLDRTGTRVLYTAFLK